MRPLDPRLLRYAQSTRGFLVLAVVLGAVTALLAILQAKLLSSVIVSVTADGMALTDVASAVAALGAVFAARAVVGWLGEVAAVRTSAQAKQQLRDAALAHSLALGPAGPGVQEPGETATLITRGVDALDGYYARYLPQLILAVIVPIAVLATILGQDVLSAVIIAVTIPLIPIFMILIGMYTKSRVDRQWRTLGRLSGHFLDLVSGLPTLKAFDRAKSQVAAIRAIGDQYRSTTMGVLRVSFLSSLVLELLATLSVALVAVSVGLRLAEGQIQYAVALFVLVLAPEAYLPLRLVGQHFHAAAEGLGAAERLFAILQTEVPVCGDADLPSGAVEIHVEGLTVHYPGQSEPALDEVTFVARPGEVTAIVGSSGGGKSTLLNALLGFLPVSSGGIRMRAEGSEQPVDLRTLSVAAWRDRIAWVPQRATLVAADVGTHPTIAQVVALGRPDASDAQIDDALHRAGLVPSMLPEGLQTRLAEDGTGLSAGQMQRVALARALVREADVLLLDEPTSALDPESEAAVVAAVQSAAAAGATVVVVAHRPALVAIADQLVRVEASHRERASAGATQPTLMDAETVELRESGW